MRDPALMGNPNMVLDGPNTGMAASMGAGEPFFAERTALRRNAARAAKTFAEGDALHREVARRMRERLDLVKLVPKHLLDAGCAIGGSLPLLADRFPGARQVALDFAEPMVRRAAPPQGWFNRTFRSSVSGVCGDLSTLPFRHGAFDLVWSNLALHWLDDPAPAIREANRVLSVGGLLTFSLLGPDTLKELRSAWAETDSQGVSAGQPAWHVKQFIDLHDIGDVLVQCGFAEPVMDMEVITLTYESLDGLIRDLRTTGSSNAMAGRPRGLAASATAARLHRAYERHRLADRLPATFEVVYGHAWKVAPRRTAAGETVVRFAPRSTGR